MTIRSSGDEPRQEISAIAPQEFCALLKAVDRQPPRLSRDLEPDLLGLALKHQILDALIAAPPPTADFETALLECAATLDLPSGTARGICSDILVEWRMAHAIPTFLAWLRQEATAPPAPRRPRREERDGEPTWRQRPQRGFGIPPSE